MYYSLSQATDPSSTATITPTSHCSNFILTPISCSYNNKHWERLLVHSNQTTTLTLPVQPPPATLHYPSTRHHPSALIFTIPPAHSTLSPTTIPNHLTKNLYNFQMMGEILQGVVQGIIVLLSMWRSCWWP